jgi:hypothetical protein
MNQLKAIYLYFYTDSVAFPRLESQALNETWPFLIREMLEAEYGVRTYPCPRGIGGATIAEIRRLFVRDRGYYRGQSESTLSFVIFNIGIVDAAPQPFTYFLRVIESIPIVGPRAWGAISKWLSPHRATLQKILSFRRTSTKSFQHIFNQLVRYARQSNMIPISLDTPLTPMLLETRSPGLRGSIVKYNNLKHTNVDTIHIPMDWVRDEHYLECGHHLTTQGHFLVAKHLMTTLRQQINVYI